MRCAVLVRFSTLHTTKVQCTIVEFPNLLEPLNMRPQNEPQIATQTM